MGVLARPEDVEVRVEFVLPSFLVDRPYDRMVTPFGGIASYAKRPPSRSQNSKHVLRFLSNFNYVINTDQTKQFTHLPLTRDSMKYCGIQTPYEGIRVYTRAAIGLPGSSEHLDELICRVLGDMIYEGSVCRIHDDLFVGGVTLRNSSSRGSSYSTGFKTTISDNISPLVSAEPPTTVKGLRSWLGDAKYLKVCVNDFSSHFSSLETAVGKGESRDLVIWSDNPLAAFRHAQSLLADAKTVPITVPSPTDQLVITTDGASHNSRVGALLHILRESKTLLGGCFSMKLRAHHTKWLPREIEA